MIITPRRAGYGINLLLHVFILFLFLTVFFFIYISKVERKNITDNLTNLINNQTRKTLSEIDKWDKKIPGANIDWKKVNKIAQDMIDQHQGTEKSIITHNRKVFWVSIGVLVALFLCLVGIVLYYKYYKHYYINLQGILGENLIIFALIGVIEILFFIFIARKYIPITPDVAGVTVIKAVKRNINKRMGY